LTRRTFTVLPSQWDAVYHQPRVSSATSRPLRKLLTSRNWERDLGDLGRRVVQLQLSAFNENEAQPAAPAEKSNSLFEAASLKISESIGDDPVEDAKALLTIPETVARRAVWKWHNIPYTVFRTLRTSLYDRGPDVKRAKQETVEETVRDIDDWSDASFPHKILEELMGMQGPLE
jgi:hypothetical protein